jgi:alkanesulfonate monooxygenase SsuD/methylene tetrahydromethanopterin reductase-like flavin-dependent oxidoreductase (luciferase family)
LFDEALDVVDRAWSATEVTMVGQHLHAAGQGLLRGHQQQAPLWIGGNTNRALRRVVTHGRGWTPLLLSAAKARSTKTAAMTTPEDLRARVATLTDLLHEAGRDPAEVPIQVDYAPILEMGPAEVVRDAVGRLGEAGATWVVSQPPTDSLEHSLDSIQRFGEDIIRVSSS